jgi:CheY-like chemotaxis protein
MSDDGDQRPKTVLIVDDEDGVRLTTSRALEMHGYRVVQACNGAEAIEVAQAEFPDLILMDLSMPKLDGFAAIHRIRRLLGLRDVPVIILSAHTAREIQNDARAAGCCEFMTKPVDLAKLLAAIALQLGPDATQPPRPPA